MFWKRKILSDESREKQDIRIDYIQKIEYEMNNVREFLDKLEKEKAVYNFTCDYFNEPDISTRRNMLTRFTGTEYQEDRVKEIIKYYQQNTVKDILEIIEETIENLSEMYGELDKQKLFLMTKDCLEGVVNIQKGYKSDETLKRIEIALDAIDYHKNYEDIVRNIEDTISNFKI